MFFVGIDIAKKTHKLLNTIFVILKICEKYERIYPPKIDVSKLANEAINSQK